MGLLVLGQLEREVFSFADSQYRSGYVVIRFVVGALRNWMSDSSKICIVLSQSAYLLITMRALSRFVSLSPQWISSVLNWGIRVIISPDFHDRHRVLEGKVGMINIWLVSIVGFLCQPLCFIPILLLVLWSFSRLLSEIEVEVLICCWVFICWFISKFSVSLIRALEPFASVKSFSRGVSIISMTFLMLKMHHHIFVGCQAVASASLQLCSMFPCFLCWLKLFINETINHLFEFFMSWSSNDAESFYPATLSVFQDDSNSEQCSR